jgi:hypothetical protein
MEKLGTHNSIHDDFSPDLAFVKLSRHLSYILFLRSIGIDLSSSVIFMLAESDTHINQHPALPVRFLYR